MGLVMLPVSYPSSDAIPPLFLAEIGALFNQDVSLAESLIQQIDSARQGPNKLQVILKSEILHDPIICLDDDTVQTFVSKSGDRKVERYRDLIERKALPLSSYSRILEKARSVGLQFCLSVYDREGADFAVTEGAVALKSASSNLPHLPLIRYLGSKGLPVIIDTGRGSLAEIDHAVRTAREAGAPQVLVEHSQDGHPAPASNCNLRSLQTLRQAFSVPVGLSDHFTTTQMMHVAIGLGVDFIERNIAAVPGALEQDHAFSSGIGELSGLLTELYESWQALGRPFRDPTNTKGLISTSGRMGLVTRRPVSPGETLSLDTVTFALPQKGIGVQHFDIVEGFVFRAAMPAGKPIAWSDVEKH